MTRPYTLARVLSPIDKDEFFASYYERKPLLVKRGDPSYWDGLVTQDDLDRVITTMTLEYPAIEATDARRTDLTSADYTYPSGLVDVVRLYKLYEQGATIIMPNLEHHLPALAGLCRSMESEASARFQTNIYLTPGASQGFRTHYDSHDVFVLQVSGKKHWKVYETPVELPFRGQGFHPKDGHHKGEITMEFELEAGDLFYLPRGVMHDAATSEEGSLHITLGVLITSWTDLLVEGIARVGLADPAFRRGLPAGFARHDFDREEARRTFRELLSRVIEAADFDALLDHFAEDLISTRHPLIRGQMAQIARLAALGVDARVGAQPSLLYRLLPDAAAEQIVLSVYGSDITMPLHALPSLRFALDTAAFRVGDLPGELDDDGKVVLVRRLVREGLVRILD